MVRRPKNEDSFDVVRPSNILVSPRCSGSTVIESSMGTDQCFHSLCCHLLLCAVDILTELCIEFSS